MFVDNKQYILSIVTPTRGNFSAYWLEQLLQIRGAVQFILVYPPGAKIKQIPDPRIKTIMSPYQGELIQRFVGLINAQSEYVLALDDDDFVHPDVVQLTIDYFARFPQSWVLRLKMAKINYQNQDEIQSNWANVPNISNLEVCGKTAENPYPFQQGKYQGLLEIPIVPLDLTKFDLTHVLWPWKPRKDMEGIHFENFNNRVWRNQIVQESLLDLAATMQVIGPLTWLPFWSLDRLLGLFIQAKFFQPNLIIGHWLPGSEQIRFIERPFNLKEIRFYLISDSLLIKRFPQYPYFWHLFFWQLYRVPGLALRSLQSKK